MAYEALILACDAGLTDVVKSLMENGACLNHGIIDKYSNSWED